MIAISDACTEPSIGSVFRRLLTVLRMSGGNNDLHTKAGKQVQRTIRPSILLSRCVFQEKAPWCLEHKVTQERGNAFEFWGKRVFGTRVEWRALGGILGVQRKHLVHLGICYIDQEEFCQVCT